VRLLLDSHTVLWWFADDAALGPLCRGYVEAADEVYISAVTPWELGIKRTLGKVRYPEHLFDELPAGGFVGLPISLAHAELAPDLPRHHRDPFDRMLVAQAQLESLALVSADRDLLPYDVEIIDARA
jgi:PIN domain nuclease of toxin-antitoxin system